MEPSRAFIDNTGKLIIENARILYRNFSGTETKFNRAGDRNFCVFIDDPETANLLQEKGWNVKIRRPRDEEDPVAHYIKVNVSYRFRAPRIFRHIGNSVVEVDEETVGELDKDDIAYCDIIINPSKWERPGGDTGLSAYLDTLHAIIPVDYFAEKYGTER